VLDLLKRTEGATLKEIMSATAWRLIASALISGSLGKKMGLKIESEKRADGVRAYKLCGSPHKR